MKATPWKAGLYGGLAGALVFGIIMYMMGMLPMVAKVVGSESELVGFVYHMFNGAIIGLLFALVFSKMATTLGSRVVWGTIYGGIWWFLGPLLLMPMMLGMGPMLSIEGMTGALPSLWGHLIFGLVLGLVFHYSQD